MPRSAQTAVFPPAPLSLDLQSDRHLNTHKPMTRTCNMLRTASDSMTNKCCYVILCICRFKTMMCFVREKLTEIAGVQHSSNLMPADKLIHLNQIKLSFLPRVSDIWILFIARTSGKKEHNNRKQCVYSRYEIAGCFLSHITEPWFRVCNQCHTDHDSTSCSDATIRC